MLARGLVRLSAGLDRLCRLGAAAGLVVMVGLIAVQVVARYVFAEPPAWTEEGARYAMVWSGLLGATIAFRAGADPVLVKIALLTDGRLARLGAALRAAAVGIFLGPLLYFCLFGPGLDPARGFLARAAARQAESLGLSMAWFAAALPVAIAVILIHLVALLAAPAAPDPGERPHAA